jgi:F-type H+-transporting ATPase subunit delta
LSNKDDILGGIAGRYASALYELCSELGEADTNQIVSDMVVLGALIENNPDMLKLIKSPVISAEEQQAAIFGVMNAINFSKLTVNFVGLVVRKRRAMFLPIIIQQFAAVISESRNELVAEVISASALTEAQINEIKTVLSKSLGKDIIVKSEIDDTLLGGLIVKAGSRMVDGSIKTKLNSLKQAMSEAG